MPITPVDIRKRKGTGPAITMLTAYDFSMAALLDSTNVLDMILVGDSLGMVALGYESTVPVTMDEMVHHCAAVSRAVKNALVVGDMPFMSYQVSPEEALQNAGRFLKQGGVGAVKLEGGTGVAEAIARMVDAGIPVVGHIGLTPQTATSLGGFKVQGRDVEQAEKIFRDAQAVADAGAFALVMECIPEKLASFITEEISIPTIGIGAGKGCDGQVLVTNDMLGLFEKFTPGFVRRYLNLAPEIKSAVAQYCEEVRAREFPSEEEVFKGGDEAVEAILSKDFLRKE